MSQIFQIDELPPVDQFAIKKGRCPWCMDPLYEDHGDDYCATCEDRFVGKLTIED